MLVKYGYLLGDNRVVTKRQNIVSGNTGRTGSIFSPPGGADGQKLLPVTMIHQIFAHIWFLVRRYLHPIFGMKTDIDPPSRVPILFCDSYFKGYNYYIDIEDFIVIAF